MKSRLHFQLVRLSLLLGLSSMACAHPDLVRLSWLAGCWAAERGDAGSTEQWMAAAGGTMLGMARTVRAGRTVEHEFMQLREAADGRLAFIAQPSNQASTHFPLLRLTDQESVFENAGHDFPQRVIYRLESADRLAARIEGLRNGVLRNIDFPMRRVVCADAKLTC